MTRTRWALAAAAVLVVATCGVVAVSGAEHPTAAAGAPAADTVKVERGDLSAMVSQGGTLTYRARPDGSPYSVINQARGVYTKLPERGHKVGCGGVLYRVDDRPVVLLCGTVPAYRALHAGVKGRDVRQLNRNLHVRGAGDAFSTKTESALRALQRRKGAHADGSLALGDAVFLPEAVRIAKVKGQVGGSAGPGAPVLSATSGTLQVQVNLDSSQQGEVKKGDRAQITLAGNTPVTGRVTGARSPTFISLDDPSKAGRLEKAPVQVDITTKGVDDALSVPVTALVGKSGGGFAVEVVRTGRRRELVAVTLGLFDTGGGRVQVEGDLRAGESVVVPST